MKQSFQFQGVATDIVTGCSYGSEFAAPWNHY